MSAIKILQFTLYGQQITELPIPIGSTVKWIFDCVDPISRAPIDLSGGNQVQMSMSAVDLQGHPIYPPIISHQATIEVSPNNRCHVIWTIGDTVISGTPIPAGKYLCDVWLTDPNGNRLDMASILPTMTAAVTLPNAPITPTPDQNPLAQGPQGLAGLTWRGTYGNVMAYLPTDAVQYTTGGVTSSYVCVLATTGNLPTNTTYWAILALGSIGPQPSLSNATPQPLGIATAGTGVTASRDDHVHATEIPSQTGNAGKFLTTDGATKSWGTPPGANLGTVNGVANSYLTNPHYDVFNIQDSYGGFPGARGTRFTTTGSISASSNQLTAADVSGFAVGDSIAATVARSLLNGSINNSVTTITVTSTANFPNVGTIYIDAEQISYTSKNATQFLGCARAQGGTTAAVHTDQAAADAPKFFSRITAIVGSVLTLFDNATNDSSSQLIELDDGPPIQRAITAALTYPAAWQASHAYYVNDYVYNDVTAKTYKCVTAGTSAGSGGPTGTSANITDGTVHWQYLYTGTQSDRMGCVVYFPPHVARGGYLIVTPIGYSTAQTGPGTGGPLNIWLVGCGVASDLHINVGGTNPALNCQAAAQEWYQLYIDGLAFTSADYINHVAPDCKICLRIETSIGWATIHNITFTGITTPSSSTGQNSIVTVVGAPCEIDTVHINGCFAGTFDCYYIFLNKAAIAAVRNVFSFSEYLYNGYDSGTAYGGCAGIIGIDPSISSSSVGRSGVTIMNIQAFSARDQNIVYFQPLTAGARVFSVIVDGFFMLQGLAQIVQGISADYVVVKNGQCSPGPTSRNIVDMHDVGSTRIENVTRHDSSSDAYGKVTFDSDCKVAEIIESPLGTPSGSPCGVVMADALSTKAYITTNGVRARVRRAQASIVANTLTKWGATDGRVDQLGTGDDARLCAGVALDAASTNDFIRHVETPGEVQIKSDGAGSLSPGDRLTSSGASAGRVKKTTTVGASTVGDSNSTVTASADALCTMIFGKSQY